MTLMIFSDFYIIRKYKKSVIGYHFRLGASTRDESSVIGVKLNSAIIRTSDSSIILKGENNSLESYYISLLS